MEVAEYLEMREGQVKEVKKCCLFCWRQDCPMLKAWQGVLGEYSPKAMITFYCSEFAEPKVVEATNDKQD